MMCSLLFAAFVFYLQRSFLFAAFVFYLQRTFFVCGVHFLFAACLFYLQCFVFICSVSLLFAACLFFFAACPLWVIVAERGRKNNCTRRDNQNGGPVRSNYSHLDNPTEE